MSDANVLRLRELDACAVSDASDQLELVARVAVGIVPLTGAARICGRVITVELGRPDGSAQSRHLCAGAVDAATDGDVIVVAHQGRLDCAGWGGNLSRAAKRNGCAGTLVDGAVRDIDESAEFGYPVFAKGATPLTARRRAQEHNWGGSVSFAGVHVDHGDYVIADSTGVVFLAVHVVDAVLAAAEQITAKEAAMARALDAGQPITDVMGASYESMLDSD